MVKVPWRTAADAATHLSRSHHFRATLWPREESPRRLGAEESLCWRSGACPQSPIPLPSTIQDPGRNAQDRCDEALGVGLGVGLVGGLVFALVLPNLNPRRSLTLILRAGPP